MLAMFFLLGHTILPHTHYYFPDHQYTFQSYSSCNFFGLLKTVLYHDLGANHLQDFRTASGVSFGTFHVVGFLVRPVLFQMLRTQLVQVVPVEFYQSLILFEQFSPDANALRAPPTV